MRTIGRTVAYGAVAAVLCCAQIESRAEDDGSAVTVLAIPARYTIVQFAFDIAALRPAVLVSYQKRQGSDDPYMHVWNPESKSWLNISIAEYSSGELFKRAPAAVNVIGDEPGMCAVLTAASGWCGNVRTIDNLDLAAVANSLDRDMDFSVREWRWLAGRYGLKLEDRGAGTQGRYGRSDRHGVSDEHVMHTPEPAVAEPGPEEEELLKNEEELPGLDAERNIETAEPEVGMPESIDVAPAPDIMPEDK